MEGYDTTTTALCALLFYLSRNGRAYTRVCLEIRTAFDHEEQIRLGPQLQSCAFLYACMNEALRMSPPVGSPLWREVGPGSEVIDGVVLQPGCTVGTGVYSMHHNETDFVDAHEFQPERWLSEQNSKKCHDAFMPFSAGPRSCIGRSLAINELTLTMAVLLWRYDVRATPGKLQSVGECRRVFGSVEAGRANAGEFQLVDRVIGHPDGPEIEFRLRDSAAQVQPYVPR